MKICNSPWKQVTPSIYPVYLWKPHICISLDQRYIPLNNCKIICPVHDLMHRYEARFPEVGELSVYLDREINYSAQCNTAAAILVDSTVGKNHVCEIYGIDPKKVFILPFIPSPLASCAKKPDNFPLNDGVPFLFYPAQLWLHKNHVNLLKAVHSLSEYFHIDCIFTGTTDKNGLDIYNNTIKNLQLEQQVHHLGYVTDDEIRWLYEHARCMIMPSFFGPTNIPPLEAMQAGCPVAVSDIYAMRERYGDAALYFNPHKVSEIANTIKLLWMDSDLCSEMKKRGYQQAAAWTQQDFEQHFLEIFHFVEKN